MGESACNSSVAGAHQGHAKRVSDETAAARVVAGVDRVKRQGRSYPSRNIGSSTGLVLVHSSGAPLGNRVPEVLDHSGDGAPGGIRTHTGWCLRPLSLPLEYRGRATAQVTGAVDR